MAQTGLWQDVSRNAMTAAAAPRIEPGSGRVVRLNQTILRDLLARAPMEFTPAARAAQVVITIPMPDGSFARFRIQESPISMPEPSGKPSEFRSYSGQGIDDPTATLRFDISSAGFHAQIISSGQSVYVDPYSVGDTTNYISYWKGDLRKGAAGDAARPECLASDILASQSASALAHPDHGGGSGGGGGESANGSKLRPYRTAIAATGEYTTFHAGGSTGDEAKTKALNAMKVTMNRVNGIWERDAAIRYVLLPDAEQFKIIYLDANTDPYTGNDASAQAEENQASLDAVITDANYDIGHVFSTAPGGVGAAGVCVTGGKARGATGSPTPMGDAFDVDYVAHEIIHQWGGNHTFNDNANSQCGGGNRTAPGAYEPGSGSTLASYAGICGPANLQKNSDDYFHSGSIAEIMAFAISTATCAQQTDTGNTPPTVTAPTEFTIPRSTPFTLTAAANDADGDTITYGWEQFDLGNPSPPETDDGTRPIFRPYKPTTSPSRTFPSLPYILNNANNPPATYTGTSPMGAVCEVDQTCLIGETMPVTTRTMKFRVFVRDNRLSGGGTNFANTNVNVRADAGPFALTAPNGGGTLTGQQTVTWDVNGTNGGAVNAANVKITLSTDGGQTFPTTLAASTPNDGTANVTMPDNTASTTCRIKVEAVGNIFFDVSDANFTITATEPQPTPTPSATPTPEPTATPVPTATPSATPTPSPSATPTVQFDSTNVTVKEDTGEAKLTVTRSGNTSGTTTVNYATADGTAKAGEDYTAESGTVTFAPNETSKEITIPVSNDPSDEPAETFAVNLSPSPQARASSGVQAAAAESSSANITIQDDDEPTTLGNIATRARVATGGNVLIGGFIITGNEPKKVIVRAIGPSLGFEGALANPRLEMFDANGESFAVNDNWQDAPNRQEIILSTIAPTNPQESAYLNTLAPGNYTAVVSGVDGGTGIGVVEVYDLDREADSKLANIATRGVVQTGSNVMIGGLIVLGNTPQRVIVRAIGPSLEVEGKLLNPALQLVDANGDPVAFNDNWRNDQQAEIEATTIPPKNDAEAAIVRTLAPGQYTAIVSGVGETTGVALVEVYALN